jgi:hypothetical protein
MRQRPFLERLLEDPAEPLELMEDHELGIQARETCVREELAQSPDEAISRGPIAQGSPVATFKSETEEVLLQLRFAGDGATKPVRDGFIDPSVLEALHRTSEPGRGLGRGLGRGGGPPSLRGPAEDLEDVVADARPPQRTEELED